MKRAILKMRSKVESKTLRIASPRSMVVRLVEREVYTRPDAATARGPVERGCLFRTSGGRLQAYEAYREGER